MKIRSMMRRVRGYLAQRRALGFRLRGEGYLLLNFARYADRWGGGGPLTNKLAITWARLPKGDNRPRWARRLEAVRGLAKFLAVRSRNRASASASLRFFQATVPAVPL